MDNLDTVTCPHCGGEISRKARACPLCGSDENTGWSEYKYLDGLDVPEKDDDDYDQIRENEFGKSNFRPLSWQVITGFALLFLILIFFARAALNW